MFDRLIFAARLSRLIRRRDGNVSMIFGLCCIVVLIIAGLAVDATRAYTVKVELGNALDAAALAVGSTQPTSTTTAGQIAELTTRLTNYVNANFPQTGLWSPGSLVLKNDITSPTQSVINVTASVKINTIFLKLLDLHIPGSKDAPTSNFDTLTVSASTQITKGTNMLELALVLDNTGSMMCGDGGSNNCSQGTAHIDSLKTDAQNIVDTLFSQSADTSKLKIAVVPYVTAVNVGPALCSGPQTCSNIATDCSGDFVTDNGNTIYDITSPYAAAPSSKFTGTLTNNSATITNVSPDPSSLAAGIPITGSGIPNGATVVSATTNSITISQNVTVSGGRRGGGTTTTTLTVSGIYGYIQPGVGANPATVYVVYPPVKSIPGLVSPTSGLPIAGSAVVGNVTTIGGGSTLMTFGVPNPQYVYYNPASSAKQVDLTNNLFTVCQNITTSYGTEAKPVQLNLTFYPPVVYDTTGSSKTVNWKGCVVEPTASGEDSTGIGPDISEPSGGWTSWSAYYWPDDNSYNNWYNNGTVSIQYKEIDGNANLASSESYGPNLSCPTPLIRLTNDQATLDNALGTQMTAWANSGTAITVGMIWGWRTLSPNAPFKDGQPYNTPGLVKAVVLETDGDAEVGGHSPANSSYELPHDFTGYGYIGEGNLGSTVADAWPPATVTNPSANYYLQTRLTQVCNAMKAAGIIVYTIGLGDGANNSQLQDCAGPAGTPGKFFPAPTASDLAGAFKSIAVSLNQLRLSK